MRLKTAIILADGGEVLETALPPFQPICTCRRPAAGAKLEPMKILVLLMLLAIVASLFSGLYFVGKDKGASDRAVTALTVRIGLSVGVFLLLMGAQYFGLVSGGRL
jgi:hypothetical protein